MDEVVFTTSSLIDILSKIDELKDVDVGIVETPDGTLQLQVGESVYALDPNNAESVEVPAEVVEDVADINDDAYQMLDTSSDVAVYGTGEDAIESGILKELAKTLAIGGMVRLSANMLKK